MMFSCDATDLDGLPAAEYPRLVQWLDRMDVKQRAKAHAASPQQEEEVDPFAEVDSNLFQP
jgi:hypothetical protein